MAENKPLPGNGEHREEEQAVPELGLHEKVSCASELLNAQDTFVAATHAIACTYAHPFPLRQFPKDFQFYPRSFVLPHEVTAFREQFDAKGRSKKTFIIKPDSGCQGRGIYLTKRVNTVDTTSSCVAQHYISKPLLIDNKRFDLRIYVLVASCKPLRLYLFKDGLVRLCTEDYVR